jgi:hypothetical protein
MSYLELLLKPGRRNCEFLTIVCDVMHVKMLVRPRKHTMHVQCWRS